MKKSKRVAVCVTNDLITDQRVARSCDTLVEMGFNVLLIGRKLKNSLPLSDVSYRCKRMKLLFNKGPLFYAEYNIRLFFKLLFNNSNILLANDLDTLLACYLVHKIKKTVVVYDTHEYFTGVPELVNRNVVRNIWETIEKVIFPKLKDVITVNDSIAQLYYEKYNVKVNVVRNVPVRKELPENISRADLGLPENKKIILLQGAGINVNRGAEEAVESMKYVDDKVILLVIGGGDVLHILQNIVSENGLEEKVLFIPKLPPDELFKYTVCADLGLSIDKDTNINYRYSLPNKLFDYINAGVPILASRLPEIEKIINKYKIGTFIENHNPEHISKKIFFCINNDSLIAEWEKNIKIAKEELNWENEKRIFKNIYQKYL